MEWAVVVSLVVVLVVYNNVANLWPPFNGPLYVPLNLALAAAAVWVAFLALDVSAASLGLSGDASDAALGLGLAVLLTLPLFVVARSRSAHRIADQRVAGLSGGALAYQVLVRIPLGTAVAEEVLFRGVLYGSLRAVDLSSTGSALVAAICFGLWHIAPTLNLVRANDPGASRSRATRAVVGAVVFTALAGVVLTCLRLRTNGLVAPIALHAGTNALGTLAAVIAARRSGEPQAADRGSEPRTP